LPGAITAGDHGQHTMRDFGTPERSAADTAEIFHQYWRVQDVDMAMTVVADDAEWHLHLPKSVVPYGGVSRGIDDIREGFFNVLAEWQYLKFEPKVVSIDGDDVRIAVDFLYYHLRGKETIGGSFRVNMQVRDGLIVRIDEYHDVARAEAFMNLVRAKIESEPAL
jgi:ketosteroid isomerase-like protein